MFTEDQTPEESWKGLNGVKADGNCESRQLHQNSANLFSLLRFWGHYFCHTPAAPTRGCSAMGGVMDHFISFQFPLKFLQVNSCVSVHSFQSIHFMHVISFQLTSFQLTKNSYKQTVSFSHVLCSKLPPWRVPGTTWYTFWLFHIYIYMLWYLCNFVIVEYIYIYIYMDFIIHIFWWVYLMMFSTTIFCEIAKRGRFSSLQSYPFLQLQPGANYHILFWGWEFWFSMKDVCNRLLLSHLEQYQYPIQRLDFISDHQWWSPFSPVRCSRYPMLSCCDDIFHWYNFGWVDAILFIYVCMFFHKFHKWYSIW